MRHVPQTFCTVVERPLKLASTTPKPLQTSRTRMESRDVPPKRTAPAPPRKNSSNSECSTNKTPALLNSSRIARIKRRYEYEHNNGLQMTYNVDDLIEVLTVCNENWVMCIKYNPKTFSQNTVHKNDKFFIPIANIQFCEDIPESISNDNEAVSTSQIIQHLAPNHEAFNNYSDNAHNIEINNKLNDDDDKEDYERKSDEAIGSSRDSLIEDDNNTGDNNNMDVKLSPLKEQIYDIPFEKIRIVHDLPIAKPRKLKKQSPEYANIQNNRTSEFRNAALRERESARLVQMFDDGWSEYQTQSDGKRFYINLKTGEESSVLPRKFSLQSVDGSNSATLPLKSTTKSLLNRSPSHRMFGNRRDSCDNEMISCRTCAATVPSSNFPLSTTASSSSGALTAAPVNAVISSDSATNGNKNTLNISSPILMSSPLTSSFYRSEQLPAVGQVQFVPSAGMPLSSTSSSNSPPSSSLTLQAKALQQLFNSHAAGNASSAGGNNIPMGRMSGQQQHSHTRAHHHVSQHHHQQQNDYEQSQHDNHPYFAPKMFPNHPGFVHPGQYSTISGYYSSQANEGPGPGSQYYGPSASELSKNRSFKTQSMLVSRPHTALGGRLSNDSTGTGIKLISQFVHKQPFEEIQKQKFTEPPAKLNKSDAIYHGTLWIAQRVADSQTEKSKKIKKNKNGIETYSVLTTNFLLCFKNEKSAFEGGKYIDAFGLLGASVQWDQTPKSLRFELVLGINRIPFYHPKEESVKKWFDAIDKHLKSHAIIDIANFQRIGSYKPQLSQDSSGTSTPPSEKKIFKIGERIKQLLRRRPPVETLKEKGIFREEEIFGRSLDSLCAKDNNCIPRFVRECVEAIESKDMKAEGLYRACGNLSNVQKLRFDINSEKYKSLYSEDDVHVLTGLLKMFFRNMPDPLFPSDMFVKLIETIDKKLSDSERIRKFRDLLQVFPTNNYETIRFILEHLLHVIQYSADNRMNIQNLAIVFGPTLLRPKDDSNNLMVDMSLQINQCRIVEFLLQNFDQIFVHPDSR